MPVEEESELELDDVMLFSDPCPALVTGEEGSELELESDDVDDVGVLDVPVLVAALSSVDVPVLVAALLPSVEVPVLVAALLSSANEESPEDCVVGAAGVAAGATGAVSVCSVEFVAVCCVDCVPEPLAKARAASISTV